MRVLASITTLLSMAGLVTYGLLFVYSSTLHFDSGNSFFSSPIKKQLFFHIIGLAAMYTTARISYRSWSRYSIFIFCAGLSLLLMVLVVGKIAGGARSWFAIGPIRFQPSESMKICWIIFLAHYLRYRSSYRSLKGLAFPFFITFVPVLLILIQPDLGTAFIFLPSLFIILYIAGAKKRHLALVAVGMILMAIPLFQYGMKDYQKMRIKAFLHPEQYEQSYAYQLKHSLLAVADGGWLGKGLGQGDVNQLDMLPDKHTDFIYSVIAEELGLLGAMGLIMCYNLLLFSFLLIAYATRDPYGRTLVFGIAVVLGIQVYTNIGVAIGLLPTTGLTLPFISAGGSSLVISCIMVGICLSVSRHHVTLLSREDFLS